MHYELANLFSLKTFLCYVSVLYTVHLKKETVGNAVLQHSLTHHLARRVCCSLVFSKWREREVRAGDLEGIVGLKLELVDSVLSSKCTHRVIFYQLLNVITVICFICKT